MEAAFKDVERPQIRLSCITPTGTPPGRAGLTAKLSQKLEFVILGHCAAKPTQTRMVPYRFDHLCSDTGGLASPGLSHHALGSLTQKTQIQAFRATPSSVQAYRLRFQRVVQTEATDVRMRTCKAPK